MTARLHECPDCGLRLRLPALDPGMEARCPRCARVLRRHRVNAFSAPLALSLAGLFLYAMILTMPFLGLNLLGRERVSLVDSGVFSFAQDGYWSLAGLVFLVLVVVPGLQLILLPTVILGLHMRAPPSGMHRLFRWYMALDAWMMVEVFLFGALVSYTRLVDLAHVEIGPSAYGIAALSLVLVARNASLEPQVVWDRLEERGLVADPAAIRRGETGPGAPPRAFRAESVAAPAPGTAAPGNAAGGTTLIACHRCHRLDRVRPGAPCPRCGSRLHHRKPHSISRSWALVVAAFILYLPANYYPVMRIVTLGQGGPHTILGGVIEFLETGFWPLALIIFLASVAVPMLKLVGLMVMLTSIRRRSARHLLRRTQLYRLVEAIGRWSMIDVFVVCVLIALVRFGVLAEITAQVGAACFAGVVVVTMVAAECFDPRLMWDAAGSPAQDPDMPRRWRDEARAVASQDGPAHSSSSTGPGEAANQHGAA
ncbi:paraquat-inducible protein A [Roseomonas gilardii subsp. gilardii]|uniref:paraquat-inducible protein A n=1 Tax=Roseomonas gilardii TaxID=257708 RepID=UPI001FF934C7|nr:paraquat-inducible protein A [Roseomonas gilardii]UPG72060.1 paraquat-inducible protein A [Roseomonas gilardii subsp. gilardii]